MSPACKPHQTLQFLNALGSLGYVLDWYDFLSGNPAYLLANPRMSLNVEHDFGIKQWVSLQLL